MKQKNINKSNESITKRTDLAINGAEPAFSEPLHVGRPNIGNRELFLQYTEQILDSRWLTNNGPVVRELEEKIAEYHSVAHCVAMCSGTIALEIAIRALKLKGEVILPSYTYIATAHALHWQGIRPVFADIDPQTHNLDPDAVRQAVNSRTTGIIGVHLWGRTAAVEALQEIANEHELKLIFDAAHAFGCSHQGRKIGAFGDCEVLSFHATKFFHTFEGGAVLTNNARLAEKMRLMRNFGFAGVDNVIYPGTNGKMTEISAAMGVSNLQAIDKVIKHNHLIHQAYQQALAGIPSLRLLEFDQNESNNYQYVIVETTEDCPVTRDHLVEMLHAENILARRYFWPGCHNMKPYRDLYPESTSNLSSTEQVSERVIVLPNGSCMDRASVEIVAAVLQVALEVPIADQTSI
ncbi:MAG: aminotransferase class I/II-fold pyridoxal phosphate-dependent enzyme [Candidatus Thiodiazotropha lotti]|uniref:Aminotransferase class I/II-fold pyridoxal phosphate-dependent enzyme n=1 Tax=Candidatus Thiodiazotropha lotti TaxID=2792787 RepID=A0A9E4K277_9GAMM|nr:aminotransferase class I/II-fold pyridoxal phosphate-dependent enzyme [Candidatus Thiodiazotropha lotti]ODB95283.1 dTDP-4-dehydro-6-deoxyglucose aminotransferase [Candidatus Thiodiazotropha endoloripes]MCG7922001.1 aminotransferase class I/II-fold pyridoxal phosphate-dependent enzyme [Candidatus Thiodiazotropha lotti]MCG7928872.1 aminotransferase class I/II-fold pyridoxal phosphate-dependent enzyme [Candidatus Thiodiazotropha lotti]MCG7937598.1 aminotransferase class I/II-fold pyridoxal phos